MKQKITNKIPYHKIDKEIIPVIKVLNKYGIKTKMCCAGHDKNPGWFGSNAYIVLDQKAFKLHKQKLFHFYYLNTDYCRLYKAYDPELSGEGAICLILNKVIPLKVWHVYLNMFFINYKSKYYPRFKFLNNCIKRFGTTSPIEFNGTDIAYTCENIIKKEI